MEYLHLATSAQMVSDLSYSNRFSVINLHYGEYLIHGIYDEFNIIRLKCTTDE